MAQGITGYFDIGDTAYNPIRLKLRVYYSESYDITANTSVLSIVRLQAMSASPNGWEGVTYYPGGSISIGGETVISMDHIAGSHSVRISKLDAWADMGGALGSITVNHNGDGSASAEIAVSLRMYTRSGGSGSGTLIAGSQSLTLTTIPRASAITASRQVANIGVDSITFSVNRYSPDFAHEIYGLMGGTSFLIAANVGDSVTWTPPYSLISMLPGKTGDYANIVCYTKLNGNTIGQSVIALYFSVPDNEETKPSASVTMTPAGNLPEAFAGLYVQGKTAVNYRIDASSRYSTIASTAITFEGETKTGESGTSKVLSVSGELQYDYTVTDARGYRREGKTEPIQVLPYAKPYLADVLCVRCNSEGIEDRGGAYVHLRFSLHYASVGGVNWGYVNWRWKVDGGAYTGETGLAYGESYENIIPGVTTDPDKAYQLQLFVYDSVGERVIYTFDLPSQIHTVHLMEGGMGVAIGKMATQEGLDCAFPAQFRESVRFDKGACTYRILDVDEDYNFLAVDLTNPYNPIHAKTFFRCQSTQTNPPFPGPFWGIREAFVPDPQHAMIIIFEQYPVPGRIWTRAYDAYTYSGGWSPEWKSITPT